MACSVQAHVLTFMYHQRASGGSIAALLDVVPIGRGLHIVNSSCFLFL